MNTKLLTVAALLLLGGCGFIASISSDATTRGLAVLGGLATSFVLGLGVGERSKSAYCQELIRINSHLGEINEALSETNLTLMRSARRGPSADPDIPA
ncbi:hypothetical protein [Botrimarina mediterranea]|uniref:Lipoprotein n=1 Tax=Botrimarina mediterranea TaxID=2528022 RepID=A0A518KBC7_9BACT|nr:hypothetical protein [Botrimarina mediterranea]QDV75101.1 hypothetical protein Spa11_33110 [Botrimarina mediterranea]QDV79747.1 hypothetical protein K2D_33630 [Planctomycetes bacterium K2D]